jgi:dihydroxyacetone kinase phosphoprotein-dependent L subunit
VTADAVRSAFSVSLESCREHESELGQLDSVTGDGDHGSGMVRGFTAACAAIAGLEDRDSTMISAAGNAFADAAGGASGALWGVFILGVGTALREGAITPSRVVAALRAGETQMERIGKSKPGDKTLLDTLVPFLDVLDIEVSEGSTLSKAWTGALVAAREATEATSKMIAKRGRSSVLGERSLGTVDPGARSLLYVLEALLPVITSEEAEQP